MNTALKYGPTSLSNFVYANSDLKDQIDRYASGSSMSPLVLYGPHGTGKSTLAKLIPEAIDGKNVIVNKVKASSLNSEKEVLDQFTRHQAFDNLFVYGDQSRNYVLIEEVNFEAKAKDAFRVVMDQMQNTDLFIFTTNNLSKIDKGLFSRATQIEVPPIAPIDFVATAQHILTCEGIEMDQEQVLEVLESVYAMYSDNRKYYDALDDLIWKVQRQKF
jgi:replication-associated recombination protein RarA